MKLFNKKELELLWPFYVGIFLTTAFLLYIPFSIIYFKTRGFSFGEISIYLAILAISPLIFEIPTGAIADLYGRKISVVLGTFLVGAIMFIIPLVNNFSLLILFFFLWGIFGTLTSGADTAWVIDLLKHKKESKLVSEYFIKERSISSLGLVISSILGSLVAKYFGLNTTWFIAGGGMVSGSIILFIFSKEYFKQKRAFIKKKLNAIFTVSKKGIAYSIQNSDILYLLLGSLFLWTGVYIALFAWQPFLKNIGMPLYSLGYVLAISNFLGIGIPYLTKPLLKKIGKEKYYLSLVGLMNIFLCLGIFFISSSLILIILLLMILNLKGLTITVEEPFFHKLISSKLRATIGSFKSMILSIGGAIAMIVGGFLTSVVGPKMTIVYSSLFVIPAIIFFLIIKKKE